MSETTTQAQGHHGQEAGAGVIEVGLQSTLGLLWMHAEEHEEAAAEARKRGSESTARAHAEDAARLRAVARALDLIRWAESQGAALEPVVGNIMPPGTYACYVGDDDDPYMGPGILGAIRAARPSDRSESDGA